MARRYAPPVERSLIEPRQPEKQSIEPVSYHHFVKRMILPEYTFHSLVRLLIEHPKIRTWPLLQVNGVFQRQRMSGSVKGIGAVSWQHR